MNNVVNVNEVELMESVNYINSLVEKVEISPELASISMQIVEEGFANLTMQQLELFKEYVTAITKAMYTTETLNHCTIIMQMTDPATAEIMKETDWTFIEQPIKNKQDMNDIEYMKVKHQLARFEIVGKATNPTTVAGFKENGRPYTAHQIEELHVTLYLDTQEYEFEIID